MDTLDEIVPGLFLCCKNKAQQEDLLQKYSITHILTVCECAVPKFPDRYIYKVAPIPDVPEIRIRDLFDENNACTFLSFIDQALSTGGRVIVHCLMGISRSATSVIAYMMWKRRMRFAEALEFVHSRHTDTDPNSGFILQLKDYQCSLVTCMQFPEDEAQVYRCSCGAVLFDRGDVIHKERKCCKFLVKSADWMRAWSDNGDVHCYFCSKRLGKYDNEGGMKCSCGITASPYFWIEQSECAPLRIQPKQQEEHKQEIARSHAKSKKR